MKKKSKSFKNFIKDLVFNNQRADRQAGSIDSDVPDTEMLYDSSKDS